MVICNCRVCSANGMWFVDYVLYVVCMVYIVRVNVLCDIGISNFGGYTCGIWIIINPMCVCIVCMYMYYVCVCV